MPYIIEEMNGKNKNMDIKKVMEIVEIVFEFIDDLPKTKKELLALLEKEFPIDYRVRYDKDNWHKASVIKAIKNFTDLDWNRFRCKLGEFVKESKRENHFKDIIFERVVSTYPDEDFSIKDLTEFDVKEFSIGFRVCEQLYSWTFSGSIKELTNAILKEIEERCNDIVKCPYCEVENIRHRWGYRIFCDCGAEIFFDMHNADGPGDSIEVHNVEEMFKADPDYKLANKDDQGCGLWFKKPDEDMVCEGSLDKRRSGFAEYLRYRQERAGYVDPEVIERLSDEEILHSYRYCTKCEEEHFSKQQQDYCLMEATSFDSAFDMMGDINAGHYDDEDDDDDFDENEDGDEEIET